MKTLGWVSTGVLSVLLGASAVAFAQDKPEDVKPPRQEEPKQDEAKPRKDEAKPENRQEQNGARKRRTRLPARNIRNSRKHTPGRRERASAFLTTSSGSTLAVSMS